MAALSAVDLVRTWTVVATAPLVPEVQLHLATRLSPLWQAKAEILDDLGCPPPFWAFPWAGGQALARHILDHPDLVRGKRVIDFACGSGLVGIAALRAGARRVWATDIDPYALAATELNAALNGVTVPTSDADLLAAGARLPFDPEVILAGDIFYEKPLAEQGLVWLGAATRRGVLALCGDAGRIYTPKAGLSEVAAYELDTDPEIEDGSRRRVRVWQVL